MAYVWECVGSGDWGVLFRFLLVRFLDPVQAAVQLSLLGLLAGGMVGGRGGRRPPRPPPAAEGTTKARKPPYSCRYR